MSAPLRWVSSPEGRDRARVRSPVSGTAPASAPDRSAPLAAGRLRRLARRLVLLAAAVGAGFVMAALLQGPAAADGMRSGSGDEPHRRIGGLVESVARLTIAERPNQDRQRAAAAGDRRHDRPRAPLMAPTGGVATPREDPPATEPRRSAGASRFGASVPPGATERERLRPASVARAAQRVDLPRPAAPAPRQPATAAPDPLAVRTPAESTVVGLITAPLPYVVDIVSTVPIRPVVMGLLRVTDAVLPPPLCPVIVPGAAPRLPAPPALVPTAVPVTEPAPVLTVPMPPAGPTLALVRAAAPPAPAAPPPMSVVVPTRATAPTGHVAARPAPVAAPGLLSGEPVAPADQDAAGVDNRSTPAPGLVRPLDRQSHLGAGQPCDLVPLLVESRTPSAIARPG
ncbi:hypothetical protein MED15_00818 [Micromonospora noduli]|uniref:Uncharacterized protein n=1 Tax=Micromonospora noduli TaxID=709876 RepID=A0ABX9DAK3_9ACTN|nr:hypothetical protein MED15_00818 [Micromonospora noduli]